MIEIFILLAVALMIAVLMAAWLTTTDTLGILVVNGKRYAMFLNGSTDGNETEIMVYYDNGGTRSIGDAFDGQTLTSLYLQLSDGSILTTAIFYDDAGGKKLSFKGKERTNSDVYNLVAENLNVQITKGMTLKINCAD